MRMGFEDNFLRGLDERRHAEKRGERSEGVSLLYGRAKELLERKEVQIEDFEDLYHGGVAEDREYVNRTEKGIERDNRAGDPEQRAEREKILKLATILEAVVLEGIEKGEWLGAHAQGIKTSRFDDLKNKVDLAVEFQNPENPAAHHLGLAIDVSFSASLEEKLKTIKKEIDGGNLGCIKYFKSPSGTFRGELNGIPRVVLGSDLQSVLTLAEVWKGNPEALKKHTASALFLKEIILQLRTFIEYAERAGKHELIPQLRLPLRTLEQVEASRPDIQAPHEKILERLKGALQQFS